MNRLDLEKAQELETKLSIFTRSERKQGNSRKTSVSASLIMLKPLTVQITTNWKILKEMRGPDHLTCLLRNLYVGQEAIVRTRHGGKAPRWRRSRTGKTLSPPQIHQKSI